MFLTATWVQAVFPSLIQKDGQCTSVCPKADANVPPKPGRRLVKGEPMGSSWPSGFQERHVAEGEQIPLASGSVTYLVLWQFLHSLGPQRDDCVQISSPQEQATQEAGMRCFKAPGGIETKEDTAIIISFAEVNQTD